MNWIKKTLCMIMTVIMTVGISIGTETVDVNAAAGDVTVTGSVSIATDAEITANDKIINITTPSSGITDDDTITYTIYKVFNATTSSGGTSYTTIPNGLELPVYDTGSDSVALSKFDVDSGGNVKYYTREQTSTTYRGQTIYYYTDWHEDSTTSQLNSNMVSELSKKENVDKYTKIGTVSITGPNKTAHVKVSEYGYYYISTYVGSAAGIDTTHPSITINDKTPFPSIDKQQSLTDGGGQPTSDSNSNYHMPDVSYSSAALSASISDSIYYKVPVTIPKDCDHPIIITDLVSEGLTLNTSNNSILAVIDEAGFALGNTIGASGIFQNYNISPWGQNITNDSFSTYSAGWTQSEGTYDENGNVWSNSSTGLKYKKYMVNMPQDLMRFLKRAAGYGTEDKNTYDFTLYYKATLNGNAQNERAEKNRVQLTYEQYTSPFHEVRVTPYGFDLVKTDKDKNILGYNTSTGGIGTDGSYATFKLYKANEAGTELTGDPISFVETTKNVGESDSDTNKGLVYNYRVATADEKTTANTTTDTIKAGDVRIGGLATGTYYLVEEKAPDGYNKITSNVKVVVETNGITVGNGTANTARYATVTVGADNRSDAGPKSGKYTSGGVQVENQAGTVLPSTGGIGTTVFYVTGGILIIGTIILLMRRKNSAA